VTHNPVARKWQHEPQSSKTATEGQTWWLTLIIPAIQEAEIERLKFEANLGKKLARLRFNQ
jgi:hypothetical protein